MTELTVAPAGAPVAEAETFQGTIQSVDMLQVKREGGTVDTYYSITIPELPPLYNDGKRVSILRTADQLRRDLKFFAAPSDNASNLALAAELYMSGRPVTLNVSAHEAGAVTVVTEHNKVAIAEGASIGDELITSSAGFYVEGFLNVSFDKDDLRAALAESRQAQAKSVGGIF